MTQSTNVDRLTRYCIDSVIDNNDINTRTLADWENGLAIVQVYLDNNQKASNTVLQEVARRLDKWLTEAKETTKNIQFEDLEPLEFATLEGNQYQATYRDDYYQKYLVTWDIKEGIDPTAIKDESKACDWSNPKSVTLCANV